MPKTLPAGTHPLPYVAVGMVVKSRATGSIRCVVLELDSDGVEIVKLAARDGVAWAYWLPEVVRERFALAEPFTPKANYRFAREELVELLEQAWIDGFDHAGHGGRDQARRDADELVDSLVPEAGQ